MSNPKKFLELLYGYVADELSSSEKAEFLNMVSTDECRELLDQHITATFNSDHLPGLGLKPSQKEDILQNIFSKKRAVSSTNVVDDSKSRKV